MSMGYLPEVQWEPDRCPIQGTRSQAADAEACGTLTGVTRGMIAFMLMVVVAACGAPAVSSVPVEASAIVQPPATGRAMAPDVQAVPDTAIDDLLADQATSDALAPRPPESIDRPGRGSLVAPDWLGLRPLPLRPDGFGEIQPTPFELIDRRFPPATSLRTGGPAFESTVGPVPAEVLARSTWQEACPVRSDELAYLTVSYVGFDGAPYIGEVMVNASVADEMVGVFRVMFDAGFPLEEVRVIAPEELDAAPTGDGNVTTAFVCRPVTGGTSWSQHAYGLAIDINPFHNPYVKGDIVLPELATVYTDRALGLPGMITEGDPVVQAFDAIGWGWGGRWTTLTDPQHFSANGR
jgi:hypothetical protein